MLNISGRQSVERWTLGALRDTGRTVFGVILRIGVMHVQGIKTLNTSGSEICLRTAFTFEPLSSWNSEAQKL